MKAQAAVLTTKLNETDTQIEAVEKEMVDKITASEATLLASLNSLRTEISAQIATINNSITALQDQDAKLDQKIAELQTYTDSEIQDMKDWAEATDWNAVATAMNSVMPKDEYTGQERTYRYRYTVSAEAGAPLALTKVDQYS